MALNWEPKALLDWQLHEARGCVYIDQTHFPTVENTAGSYLVNICGMNGCTLNRSLSSRSATPALRQHLCKSK